MSFYFQRVWPWIWKIKSKFSGKKLALGRPIPNFKLATLDGISYRLSEIFPNKGTILWLTNLCEECEKKISFLEEIRRQYGGKWEVLAISILGEERQKPSEILGKHEFGFPLLLDPKDWTGKVLGLEHHADACPMFNLLVLDSRGLLRFKAHLSAIPEDRLRQALRSAEAGN